MDSDVGCVPGPSEFALGWQIERAFLIRDLRGKAKKFRHSHLPLWYNVLKVLENGYQSLQEFDFIFFIHLSVCSLSINTNYYTKFLLFST